VSRESERWWRDQGYSQRPGGAGRVNSLPKGHSPEAQLLRDRFEAVAGAPPDDVYSPTASINPADPRTTAMFYWRAQRVVNVSWGDGGAPYNYYNVSPGTWEALKKAPSPGQFINRVLNSHEYGVA